MTDHELAALANGLAPYVRDCVAEGFKVPPELAAQIANAVRILHESPELEPKTQPPATSPRLLRIKRDGDGNFVPVYDEVKP
jgi:hypothetical protein